MGLLRDVLQILMSNVMQRYVLLFLFELLESRVARSYFMGYKSTCRDVLQFCCCCRNIYEAESYPCIDWNLPFFVKFMLLLPLLTEFSVNFECECKEMSRREKTFC